MNKTKWLSVVLAASVCVGVAGNGPARADTVFPIFSPSHRFECSPLKNVGCSGLFPVRDALYPSDRARDPYKPANTLAILSNGDDSLTMRLRMLNNAKRSVRVQALIFTGDEAGLKIAKRLKELKKSNPRIDIRVIVDGISNVGWQTQWMYYDLKQHGIEIEGYEALYMQWVSEITPGDATALNKRFHDKMFIVDAEDLEGTAIVGGLNIANEYFRVDPTPKNRWRDQDTVLQGDIVQDVARAFDRNYQYFKQLKADRPSLANTDSSWKQWRKSVIKNFGKFEVPYRESKSIKATVDNWDQRDLNLDYVPSKMRFFQNRPRFKESYIHQAYLSMIRAAQREIIIANAYFIPEQDLIDALKDAARRGVHVRILTNSLESNDTPPLAYASRYTYQDLMEGGPSMDIHEWIGTRIGEGTLHAKFAVFDRQAAIVGSHNLDTRSQRLNSETVIAFESIRLAGQLARLFVSYDLKRSQKITREQAVKFHDPSKAIDKINVEISNTLKPLL